MKNTALQSNQREQEILRELRLAGGNCRIAYLAECLAVSDETIRRNIKTLQSKSLVKKVHGGVYLTEDLTITEPPFQSRMAKNSGIKKLLAIGVAKMIKDGDSLFLDIGSTTAYIAEALRNHHNLYIVTNSVMVSSILATINNNRVFLAGGELRSHDGGAFGYEAIRFIKRFNVQYAILSIGAINAENGFMLHDIQEADLSKEAAATAQTIIAVADHEKFGRLAPIAFEDANLFDVLVTDKQPSADICKMLNDNEVDIVIPGR